MEPAAADSPNVERAVRDLAADYDRRDGDLSKSDVERLVEKRHLSINEIAEVYTQLESLGISLADEEQSQDEAPPEYESDTALDLTDDERSDPRTRLLQGDLLTAEEEVQLGRRMALGRRAQREIEEGATPTEVHRQTLQDASSAREQMIVANLRLVAHVARMYEGLTDLQSDDLFQEGVFGLARAADKYDHTLGYKFSTYATWWIRQSITRALADRGSTIRLPVHFAEDVNRFKRAERLLTQAKFGRAPTARELADELTWTLDKVHFVQAASNLVPKSLDAPIPGVDEGTLLDTLPADGEGPEEHVERLELTRSLQQALSDLTGRERKVLSLRFGLDGGQDSTLEQIGRMFDVTRERIRQIEAKALTKMRHPNRSHLIRPFLESDQGSGHRDSNGDDDDV